MEIDRRLRRFGVTAALFPLVLTAPVLCAPGTAAAQERTYRFDIPAQSLSSALRAFGRASRQQVIFSEEIVRGRQSPALIGAMTVDGGLERLLRDSGLESHRTPAGVIYIQRIATAEPPAAAPPLLLPPSELDQVVVTGSRIRRTGRDTAEPGGVIPSTLLNARGFTNVAQALNELPQVRGSSGSRAGTISRGAASGREFINLFNLGTQRTLTLVNGRRFVGSNPAGGGGGGNQVDMNNVPLGLIERVETVQAAGSAIYGSDAIAGVINVILKKDFEGADVYAQTGLADEGDFSRHLARGTVGRNFLDGRANLAVNFEWAKTDALLPTDRDAANIGYNNAVNPANRTNTDGIPARVLITDWRIPEANPNGVIFRAAGSALASFLRVNGSPVQFAPGGGIIPHDLGTYYGVGASSGGDGFNFGDFYTLFAATERFNATALGHIDLTDNVRLTTELTAAKLKVREPVVQPPLNMAISAEPSTSTRLSIDNAFLLPSSRATLQSAGITDSFWISRTHYDLIDQSLTSNADTYRALVGLEGDFNWQDREFYWNVAVNRGVNEGSLKNYDLNRQGYLYAVDAVASPSGPVCRVTRDNPNSTDPLIRGCQPVNLFGQGSPSQAAKDYLSLLMVTDYKSVQTNAQANFGGELFRAPAGPVSFSAGLEYRKESSEYEPNDAVRLGLGRASAIPPVDGSYNTREVYGEALVPILGGDFTLPFITKAEVTGSYRWVKNSLAGKNDAWSYGGRVTLFEDLTLRGTKSSTFRAPSLLELFLPRSTVLQAPGLDPCDQANINAGAVPSIRQANCRAAFTALGLPAGFQLNSQQNIFQNVSTGGNPDLKNETADSWTLGFVYQPRFAPGLTFTADWVKIDVRDAITNFTLQTTLPACYDNPQPSPYCNSFRRGPDGRVADGTAQVGFSNAGYLRFAAESYAIFYDVPLDRLFAGADPGRLSFNFNAMHTRRQDASASGLIPDTLRTAGTVSSPDWVWTLQTRYARGPVSLTWTTLFTNGNRFNLTDTIEQRDLLRVKDYVQHDAALEYEVTDRLYARAVVANLFDATPPYGTLAIGDLVGRYFHVGVGYRF